MLIPDEWIEKHRHDLDGWYPTIEIITPTSKQTIIIKSKEAERAVIKILKEGNL